MSFPGPNCARKKSNENTKKFGSFLPFLIPLLAIEQKVPGTLRSAQQILMNNTTSHLLFKVFGRTTSCITLSSLCTTNCSIMCGRAACTLAPAAIVDRYKPKNGFRHAEDYRPSPNIAPFGKAHLPVLSLQHDTSSNAVTTDVAAMRWGLIPVWQKEDVANNDDPKSFNARIGTFIKLA